MPDMDAGAGAGQHGGVQPDRHIPLQGASNFRDFGGYRTAAGRTVRWRRVFRSDRLSELTAADYDSLEAFGIRRVYDLRRDVETAAWPTRWVGSVAPDLICAPMFNDALGSNAPHRAEEGDRQTAAQGQARMIRMYVRMVTEPYALAALRRIFGELTTPDAFPALFHCAGGKDRTGVTCALILSVLGVARSDVVEDYMLTGRYYDADANLERNVTQAAGDASGGWSREALAPMFGVQPAYIETALELVDAAGGAEAFLTEKVGVSPADLQRLREQLLD
jgi:protein-tyrosine phosphatase